MISDEERREVARRLRKLDHVVTNCDTIESGVNKFIKAVYGDRPYSPIECSTRNLCGLAMTLANLVDRPTCETIEHGRPDEFHVCKSCSRCSYGWFEDIHDKPYSYCPNCGAEVVHE